MIKRIMELIKILYETILDLIYPEDGICFICDEYDDEVKEDHVCPKCREQLIFNDKKTCSICGKPLEKGYLLERCPSCMKHPHYFSKAISPLIYEGLIKNAIYTYKYGKKPYMYRAFGYFLVQALEQIDYKDIDYVMPVPLHRSKKVKRGFNQSEILARFISKHTNISFMSKNLVRSKKTRVQNKLHKIDRLRNVKGAFKTRNEQLLMNKKILLVDDIFTTGATCDECSKVLLGAGAREVVIITLATGKNN